MSLDFSSSLEELEAAEAETANPYLADPARGLELITRLIAQPQGTAPSEQRQHLHRLHQLIHQSFVNLAARDDYPAEAQAYRALLALEQSLEALVAFPTLANKTVIGVGGGFSAGKSRFLNSLLCVNVLPESLEPTTAIPSYIVQGQAERIIALNSFTREIPLDRSALQAITHAFQKHYQQTANVEVGFAHILRLLMIHLPGLWQRLAFLDTPGYSKADRLDAAHSDAQVAQRQLAEADHVIWLLSAKNGSIRRDDLEFLRTLKHPKPIFFIVTQADLVSRSQLPMILDSTARKLDEAGIVRAGLMAWAAPPGTLNGQHIAGDDARAWLDMLNSQPKRTQKRLACARVLDAIIAHNSTAATSNREQLAAMNELMIIADNLPQARRETLRLQIERLRHDQRRLLEMVGAFGDLKQQMLETITRIVGGVAEDEEVQRQHVLMYRLRRDWLSRPLVIGEHFEVRVLASKSQSKKVIVEFGDGIASTGLSFSMIRGGLRIDPEILVKGSLLHGEVRFMDHEHVTLAISDPLAAD
ncbi:dynamin family protein [Pseudomonas plecoglossicida]|uniref:dynamin family protein n=1 Tax=Pseudomonas plecoglossicida TaxID=70775 RepID=UPI003D2345A7